MDDILKEVKILDTQAKNFKEELYKICWYMRGSITFDEIYGMSPEDREIISKIIQDNIETTKKSGLPFF